MLGICLVYLSWHDKLLFLIVLRYLYPLYVLCAILTLNVVCFCALHYYSWCLHFITCFTFIICYMFYIHFMIYACYALYFMFCIYIMYALYLSLIIYNYVIIIIIIQSPLHVSPLVVYFNARNWRNLFSVIIIIIYLIPLCMFPPDVSYGLKFFFYYRPFAWLV
jgi:hypothetical protein